MLKYAFAAMRDELEKIAAVNYLCCQLEEIEKLAERIPHEEQRYIEYMFGYGRGGASAATPAQISEARRVMGRVRGFAADLTGEARQRGVYDRFPPTMHIPVGQGHTALVERSPKGLIVKTVYDKSYKQKGPELTKGFVQKLLGIKPTMSAKKKLPKKLSPAKLLQQQFGVSKKRLKTLAKRLPEVVEAGGVKRLSPSLRLPPVGGGVPPAYALGMSKQRLSKLSKRVAALAARGIKLGYVEHAWG